MDMTSLPFLGTVLSHGYIAAGFLPTRIAFPSLACSLLGVNIETPSNIFLEAFSDSLSQSERSSLKDALNESNIHFSSSMSSKLITIILF